ncbi:MAG: hypothetical protein IJP99_09110 [Methanobrevibacter sp.]|nr:hypothetical protein [Methanobrevibacter sp.]
MKKEKNALGDVEYLVKIYYLLTSSIILSKSANTSYLEFRYNFILVFLDDFIL